MTLQGISEIMAAPALVAEVPGKRRERAYTDVLRYELDYVTRGLHKSCYEAYSAIQWFLNDVVHRESRRKRWVSLLGASGCGKSHLGRMVVEVLLASGCSEREVQFWGWTKAMERILADRGVMRWLIDLPVLVLDDIGSSYDASEKARALNASLLYELLEGRLGKWTVITSNLAPGNIAERLDVRIASRLYRGLNEIVDMAQADDYPQLQYERRMAQAGRRQA